jgi:hypothetical protein
MTQAVSGCGGGSSRDRTPRWTTLMWRKTISPGPLPMPSSGLVVELARVICHDQHHKAHRTIPSLILGTVSL